MPEEKFHAKFGKDSCLELVQAGHGEEIQDALDRYIPITPAFFGASQSKNNEIYRKWGLKQRTNDEDVIDEIGQPPLYAPLIEFHLLPSRRRTLSSSLWIASTSIIWAFGRIKLDSSATTKLS